MIEHIGREQDHRVFGTGRAADDQAARKKQARRFRERPYRTGRTQSQVMAARATGRSCDSGKGRASHRWCWAGKPSRRADYRVRISTPTGLRQLPYEMAEHKQLLRSEPQSAIRTCKQQRGLHVGAGIQEGRGGGRERQHHIQTGDAGVDAAHCARRVRAAAQESRQHQVRCARVQGNQGVRQGCSWRILDGPQRADRKFASTTGH